MARKSKDVELQKTFVKNLKLEIEFFAFLKKFWFFPLYEKLVNLKYGRPAEKAEGRALI